MAEAGRTDLTGDQLGLMPDQPAIRGRPQRPQHGLTNSGGVCKYAHRAGGSFPIGDGWRQVLGGGCSGKHNTTKKTSPSMPRKIVHTGGVSREAGGRHRGRKRDQRFREALP